MAVFFKRILYFASVALARCGQYQRKQRFHEAKMTASHNAREIEITRETINGAFFSLVCNAGIFVVVKASCPTISSTLLMNLTYTTQAQALIKLSMDKH